jgi:hypothetical protein
MENKIIYHRGDKQRWKNSPLTKKEAKEILYKQGKFTCDINSLILDHIIVYYISENSNLENLQLLNFNQNKIKTAIDLKSISQLKKEGLVVPLTCYSVELLAPKEKISELP